MQSMQYRRNIMRQKKLFNFISIPSKLTMRDAFQLSMRLFLLFAPVKPFPPENPYFSGFSPFSALDGITSPMNIASPNEKKRYRSSTAC